MQHKKLFVGCLAPKTTENDIVRLFSRYGRITDVFLFRNKSERSCKGHGYVVFQDRRAVLDIINDQPHRLFGRTLITDWFVEGQRLQERRDDIFKRKVYVSNIPTKLEDWQLKQKMEAFGEVENAYRMKAPRGNYNLPYGYVIFVREESARKAASTGYMDALNRRMKIEKFQVSNRKKNYNEKGRNRDSQHHQQNSAYFRKADIQGQEASYNSPNYPQQHQGSRSERYQHHHPGHQPQKFKKAGSGWNSYARPHNESSGRYGMNQGASSRFNNKTQPRGLAPATTEHQQPQHHRYDTPQPQTNLIRSQGALGPNTLHSGSHEEGSKIDHQRTIQWGSGRPRADDYGAWRQAPGEIDKKQHGSRIGGNTEFQGYSEGPEQEGSNKDFNLQPDRHSRNDNNNNTNINLNYYGDQNQSRDFKNEPKIQQKNITKNDQEHYYGERNQHQYHQQGQHEQDQSKGKGFPTTTKTQQYIPVIAAHRGYHQQTITTNTNIGGGFDIKNRFLAQSFSDFETPLYDTTPQSSNYYGNQRPKKSSEGVQRDSSKSNSSPEPEASNNVIIQSLAQQRKPLLNPNIFTLIKSNSWLNNLSNELDLHCCKPTRKAYWTGLHLIRERIINLSISSVYSSPSNFKINMSTPGRNKKKSFDLNQ